MSVQQGRWLRSGSLPASRAVRTGSTTPPRGAPALTVFAGAPDTYPEPMTWWDQLAGFSRGDDPLIARRREDADALDALGAKPVWLDFIEHQYLDRDDWVRPAAIVGELD